MTFGNKGTSSEKRVAEKEGFEPSSQATDIIHILVI